MKSLFKPLLLAGLLASAGFSAWAQAPAAGDCPGLWGAGGPMMQQGGGHHRMGRWDASRMQAWMDKRHAELKTQLKLSPEQEKAWTAYTAVMTPPAALGRQRPDFAELAQLPTPERLDKMKALRAQHIAEMSAAMDQRADATKAFYAALTAEQQKVFDAHTLRPLGARTGRGGPRSGPAPAAQPKP